MLTAVSLLALVDLLGEAVAARAGAFGGGGVLAALPDPVGRWLSPPPYALLSPVGLAGFGGLALVAALSGIGASRLGARRGAGLLALLGLIAPLAIWNPLAIAVMGGQALVLAAGRGGAGADDPARTRAAAQAARVLGLTAAVLLTWTTPPALVVTLVAVALAPTALEALSAPVAGTATEDASSRSGAAVPAAPAPAAPPALAAVAVAPEPTPDAGAGPFGHDPVAALEHLAPASALVEAARAALARGEVPIVAVVRLDGLAGIAEHLGVRGGEALFAESTERLAAALPDDGMLSWMGDETFAALLPAAGCPDLGVLGETLAAPFTEDLIVDHRPISMEDAVHVDAMALDQAALADLASLAKAGAPGSTVSE
ncbi:hypothetical protein [Roseospira goensis]|uniref:GGDEF domain-containing protein n=1 Tax=Roseospira goensis TaxID=391922 RepID=A0A7W6WJK2_9PROT|nr:hypothetical protein [Roseospira goensis]MBB4285346.1 GGDEF domain-containing protein [Roseospira goensis]